MYGTLRTLLLLLSVPGSMVTGKGQFNDDFDDLDFTTGVVWTGNDGLFTAASGQLRSQSPGASNYYLSTASSLVNDAEWEFFLDLRFATSGANYVDVHVMSDLADLSSTVSGYFVRIGGTADRIEFFRRSNGIATSTGLQSPDGLVNSSTSNPFLIKVTRSAAGAWSLFFDDGATGTYVNAGSVIDVTHTTASFFGIRIEQSSAASAVNNHFFDDIVARPITVDNTPPTITTVEVIDASNIDVIFDEAVDLSTANDENNYEVQPFIMATTAMRDGAELSRVHLSLTAPLTNGNTYTLITTAVQDLAGNAMPSTQFMFDYIVPTVAGFRDVVMNEIMADPSPTVGLPEVEFVELHNPTTDRTVDLTGWTFSDGGTPVTIPGYTLPPGGYVVLMANASLPLYPNLPNKIGLTSLPALNNDGDALELKNSGGALIDAVTYALSWYQDAAKDDGGWTLEQIDPTSPCSGASNWRASTATAGGTPGAQNSVFAIVPDTQAPSLVAVQIPDNMTLVLVFSEAMDAGSLVGGNYSISPSISTGDVTPVGTNSASVTLLEQLDVGTVYTVVVTDVSDCPGNLIGANNSASFALPEPVEAGDVVINEVLYDPIGPGSDMVELYNRSAKVLSLAGWKLANVSDGVVGTPLVITTNATLLLPGEFVLLCEDQANIVQNYPQSRTERFLVTDIPTYNNDNGSVVLQAPDGMQLDRFDYSDDLHFALINNTEGYTLERVDPDRPTTDNTNWQSAADVAGKATPGFRNSQYAKAPEPSGEMTIDPSIFSPDNDGYQDLLTISYRMDEPGFVGNVTIYDITGREARRLMESELLGTEGVISWNGLLDNGGLARMGPYIVLLETFDLDGNVERFKQTVTLAHRLD
ncbi:MAG: lamin tail domain-containing protein [Flavobacteriales bacterium]|nr:lamin tail domain-containing protein [Flavobacteriales bacterium]